MQNELTAERIAAAIRVVETEQKCVMRNADGYCDRQCEKCDLLMLVAEILGGYDTALGALREQAERSKGCEYCRGWDSRCGASYCPMCGRELGKRLEVEQP